MKPLESGTVSLRTRGWPSPSLSSRDCSMLGMVTLADVIQIKFRLCFVLLLQFSFNSLALPLLTSFRFSTPPFFALFRFVAKAVFLWVSIYCNLNVKIS